MWAVANALLCWQGISSLMELANAPSYKSNRLHMIRTQYVLCNTEYLLLFQIALFSRNSSPFETDTSLHHLLASLAYLLHALVHLHHIVCHMSYNYSTLCLIKIRRIVV